MFWIGICIGFSLGIAVSSIYVWFRDADPTHWTREDQERLNKEMYQKCPKPFKYGMSKERLK